MESGLSTSSFDPVHAKAPSPLRSAGAVQEGCHPSLISLLFLPTSDFEHFTPLLRRGLFGIFSVNHMNETMQANQQLIDGLNEDLAAEWGTIMRYTFQSAKALGLRGAELREILEKDIPDELGHARYLTDVISDLGGEPTME